MELSLNGVSFLVPLMAGRSGRWYIITPIGNIYHLYIQLNLLFFLVEIEILLEENLKF